MVSNESRFLRRVVLFLMGLSLASIAPNAWSQTRPPSVTPQRPPMQGPARPGQQPALRNAQPPTQQPVTAPKGFTNTPAQQDIIDQMLTHWEGKTSGIKTFRAEFTRWVYDPVFGPKDPNQAATVTRGEVRYAAPDRGMIRESEVYKYDEQMAQQGAKEPLQEGGRCRGRTLGLRR